MQGIKLDQTDATTPNIVASCCARIGSGVQTDATTPNNAGTCSASREGHNPEDFGDHV